MSSPRAIMKELRRAAANGQPVVLATVVRITGSSYGGVGTRMVVHVDGSTVGLVSGGCLESDLAEHAREVHASGRARVVTYDTRADDDAAWGLGLGCNGLIEVLLEPLDPDQSMRYSRILETCLSHDSPSVIATVTAAPGAAHLPAVGAHTVLNPDCSASMGKWGDGSILSLVGRERDAALEAGRRGLVHSYGDVQIAFEVMRPVVRLVICGSGPDVVPLARIAGELGWNVTVVDHRPSHHASSERFPAATVIDCADPQKLPQSVSLDDSTAAVIMSHHFGRDLDYLRALLDSSARYIGILGPRARAERMLAELGAEISHGERMYSPVGMDIGGDGPDSIALAIIAEVSAVMSKRSGGHLRDRRGPLHEATRPALA